MQNLSLAILDFLHLCKQNDHVFCRFPWKWQMKSVFASKNTSNSAQKYLRIQLPTSMILRPVLYFFKKFQTEKFGKWCFGNQKLFLILILASAWMINTIYHLSCKVKYVENFLWTTRKDNNYNTTKHVSYLIKISCYGGQKNPKFPKASYE